MNAGRRSIEAALVLPLLLLVVLGILDFGLLFWRFESVTNAAREGARVAILPGYSTTDVENRVQQYLTDAGLDADAPVITVVAAGRRGRRRRHVHHDDGRHGFVSARLLPGRRPGGLLRRHQPDVDLAERHFDDAVRGRRALRVPVGRELQLLLGCMRSIA